MTDNNWPDPARPGVPLNPERDGWHWRRSSKVGSKPGATWWCASERVWQDGPMTYVTVNIASQHYYLGPCLTPAEVEARVAQARRDAMEEAARVAEEHEKKAQAKLDELTVKFFSEDPSVGKASSPTAMIVNSRKIAAAIRALKGEGDD